MYVTVDLVKVDLLGDGFWGKITQEMEGAPVGSLRVWDIVLLGEGHSEKGVKILLRLLGNNNYCKEWIKKLKDLV